jgi:peptidyl-tRNA hydrolase
MCRSDLEWNQRAVQSCHAVAEFMTLYGHLPEVREWATKHRTMVLLRANSEMELMEQEERLNRMGIPTATFLEPDIGNQRTAMAISPAADPKLFRNFKLL